jgi:hypothetical protein
MRVLS